jgi:hypothetical protein
VIGLILVESLISFGWMIYIGQRIFLGAVTPVCAVNRDPPLPMSITLFVLMLASIAAPVVGVPLVRLIGG